MLCLRDQFLRLRIQDSTDLIQLRQPQASIVPVPDWNCRGLSGVQILIGPIRALRHRIKLLDASRCLVRTLPEIRVRSRHFVHVAARWVLEPCRIILLQNDRLPGEEVARIKIRMAALVVLITAKLSHDSIVVGLHLPQLLLLGLAGRRH